MKKIILQTVIASTTAIISSLAIGGTTDFVVQSSGSSLQVDHTITSPQTGDTKTVTKYVDVSTGQNGNESSVTATGQKGEVTVSHDNNGNTISGSTVNHSGSVTVRKSGDSTTYTTGSGNTYSATDGTYNTKQGGAVTKDNHGITLTTEGGKTASANVSSNHIDDVSVTTKK